MLPLVIVKHKQGRKPALRLAGTLRVAADNLDPIGVDRVGIVQLEVDIFDDERPNIVTEAVGIEVPLTCL